MIHDADKLNSVSVTKEHGGLGHLERTVCLSDSQRCLTFRMLLEQMRVSDGGRPPHEFTTALYALTSARRQVLDLHTPEGWAAELT